MAGKVQAKRNVARLKAAAAAIAEMLKELGDEGGGTTTTTEAARDLVEALLRQSDSVDGRREVIRAAIKEKLRDPMIPDQYVYVWLRDLFVDTVVYDRDGTLFQIAYTIDKTTDPASVILGDPVEVEICYVPKAAPVQESAFDEAFIPLVEKAVRRDGTIPIKIINPGWGSSGYYPKDVLERDGPKVFTKGLKMYWNHPTPEEERQRPERDLNDLAAILESNARWDNNGADGPGLYADAKVYEAYQQPVNDLAADIGVSIRAAGTAKQGEAEGRRGTIIESIVGARSVDFVTDPGRGGKILQLFEAARGGTAPKPTTPTKEDIGMLLSEAEQKRIQDENAALKEAALKDQTELARLREADILREARTFVSATLPVSLPQLTRDRLIESLGKAPVLKDGQLDKEAFKATISEAVKAEVEYLAKVTGSGAIRGMGETLQEGADAAGVTKPEDAQASLKESFALLGLSESAAEIAAKGR